jgi:hypothetical protein
MLNIRNISLLFLLGFLLFSSTTPTYAQRPVGQCGQSCPAAGCQVGKQCINGTCYEAGCNPAGGDPPCCKSQRVIRPTTPPGGGGGGGGSPTTPGTTPGTIVTPGPGKSTTPGMTPLTPFITITPGGPVGGSAGDCSGPTEGVKDGKVDLVDFNLLRKELSGSSTTVACDFDTNGLVDLLDFNIFRIAFIAQK